MPFSRCIVIVRGGILCISIYQYLKYNISILVMQLYLRGLLLGIEYQYNMISIYFFIQLGYQYILYIYMSTLGSGTLFYYTQLTLFTMLYNIYIWFMYMLLYLFLSICLFQYVLFIYFILYLYYIYRILLYLCRVLYILRIVCLVFIYFSMDLQLYQSQYILQFTCLLYYLFSQYRPLQYGIPIRFFISMD